MIQSTSVGGDVAINADRDPLGLCHGVQSGTPHQRYFTVDVVNKNAACGWGIDAYLPLGPKFGLLDTKLVLVIIYALINLPIIIMILFNYFREIPKEILEASRMDGTSTLNEITQIVIPLASGALHLRRCSRSFYVGMKHSGQPI